MSKLFIYPNQMLSYKEKMKVLEGDSVPDWIKRNAEYFSSEKYFSDAIFHEMNTLYNIAEGRMYENDNENKYSYLTNPFNTDNPKYLRYPAKLKHYSIIAPIIQSYLGEKRAMPHNLTVISTNPEAHTERKEALNNELKKALEQKFFNELNAQGMETGVPTKPVENINKIKEEFELTWNDRRSILGQEAYDFIVNNLALKEQYVEQMYDWLVAGRVVSYKTVNHNDVLRENIDPRHYVPIGLDSTSPFFEDATGGVAMRYWNAATIINRFREKLTPEQIQTILNLENKFVNATNEKVYAGRFTTSNGTNYLTLNNGAIPVEHITWMSVELRKILKYVDTLGAEREMIVSEDYVFEKDKGDLEVTEVWENQWWEVWRIVDDFTNSSVNTGSYIYLDWGIGEVQRNDIDNTSVCKLPYNGRVWGTRTTTLQSIVKDLVPYQELYDVLHYRFELTLAKSKESLLLFPLQAVPRFNGWDYDRFMYSIGAFSIAFFDASDKDVKAALQAMKSVDMALANYMNAYWSLMLQLKTEAWDRVGMNRQRYGDTMASDLKGVNQQAIYQSSLLTKNLFETFNRYEEVEAAGLLDYSKYAWIDGKKGTYVNDDGRRRFIEVNGVDFLESNFDTFVKSSYAEKEKLEQMRALAQSVAQNSNRVGDMAEIIDANNFATLKRILNEADKAQKEFEATMQKQAEDAQKYVADKAVETEKIRDERERYKIDKNAETDIEVALITSDSFNAGKDENENQVDDSQEILERWKERQAERERLIEDKRKNMANEQLAREKMANDLKITKERNKKTGK